MKYKGKDYYVPEVELSTKYKMWAMCKGARDNNECSYLCRKGAGK